MEKEKVTREQAVERINDNYEIIDTAYGRIRASKKFFAVTGTIGALSTGVGIAGLVVTGFTLLPITVTALGVAAAGVSAKFYSDENKECARLQAEDEHNQTLQRRIEAKDQEKVKVKSK
ncbi:MAG: hypothetical protein IJN90_05810 [Bacilli bacterium]|nr:hypothetical protein [Bacilli bacterium]